MTAIVCATTSDAASGAECGQVGPRGRGDCGDATGDDDAAASCDESTGDAERGAGGDEDAGETDWATYQAQSRHCTSHSVVSVLLYARHGIIIINPGLHTYYSRAEIYILSLVENAILWKF